MSTVDWRTTSWFHLSNVSVHWEADKTHTWTSFQYFGLWRSHCAIWIIFLALELFCRLYFFNVDILFHFWGKCIVLCIWGKKGKTWWCNVKLHIKYLEFLQKRFMTYSLLSKNVTNVNEVQWERVRRLCFLWCRGMLFMEGTAVSSSGTSAMTVLLVQPNMLLPEILLISYHESPTSLKPFKYTWFSTGIS